MRSSSNRADLLTREIIASAPLCVLVEIVDDRYDKGSLLITSQVPVAQWFDVIGEHGFS